MKREELDEYLIRNRDVAIAYGLKAGLKTIKNRMQRRKDCPVWLMEKLDDMISRTERIISSLIAHREELKEVIVP